MDRARIGATAVCFRDWFAQTPPQYTSGREPLRRMKLIDYPRFVADELGLPMAELWSLYFDDRTLRYCGQLGEAAAKAGVTISNIQLDAIPADLAAGNEGARAGSIYIVKHWMDRAAAVGAPRVRANTDIPTPGRPFDPDRIADSFRQLADYGDQIGVDVLIENHFGYSAIPANVVAIHERVRHPRCAMLCDWGNSSAKGTEARIADLSQMFDGLGFVAAKGVHFDAAYRHLDYDIGELVRATEASGYRGPYSVELFAMGEGMPVDPVRAVLAVADAVSANLRSEAH